MPGSRRVIKRTGMTPRKPNFFQIYVLEYLIRPRVDGNWLGFLRRTTRGGELIQVRTELGAVLSRKRLATQWKEGVKV